MKKILLIHPHGLQIKSISDYLGTKENVEIWKFPGNADSFGDEYQTKMNEFDVIISSTWFSTINRHYGEEYIKTNKNQIIIEMTHGTWVKELWSKMNPSTSGIDYVLSSCEWSTDVYLRNGYKKSQILEFGLPRVQEYELLNKKKILSKLIEIIPEAKGKEIVTYAPTWTNYGELEGQRGVIIMNINKIYNSIKRNQILIVAPHRSTLRLKNIKFKISITNKIRSFLKKNIATFDSLKLKGDELMNISNILITDYSSIIFDFVNLSDVKEGQKRVGKFFFPDIEKKQKNYVRAHYKNHFKRWGKSGDLVIDRENPIIGKEFNYFNSCNFPEKSIDGIKAMNDFLDKIIDNKEIKDE